VEVVGHLVSHQPSVTGSPSWGRMPTHKSILPLKFWSTAMVVEVVMVSCVHVHSLNRISLFKVNILSRSGIFTTILRSELFAISNGFMYGLFVPECCCQGFLLWLTIFNYVNGVVVCHVISACDCSACMHQDAELYIILWLLSAEILQID